jgi:hypothetical protein
VRPLPSGFISPKAIAKTGENLLSVKPGPA